MARKKSTHRPNLPSETLERARREGGIATPAQVAKPVAKKKAPQVDTSTLKVTMEDLASEYAYVVSDLRNMGMLAAALFAILIVLSFIL